MDKRDSGFSILEVAVVVLILGILAAVAVPTVVNAVQAYRLHSDASGIAGYFNIVRMRAASQYSPYALDVSPATAPPTYVVEKLTSTTYNPLGPPSTGGYASFNPPAYDTNLGTQYASQGTTYTNCRPSGITKYPGTITADPSSCAGSYQFCFNTRGSPVQCASGTAGTPLGSGGLALYLTNQSGLYDAVTIAVGGVVQVWNWDPSSAQWYQR